MKTMIERLLFLLVGALIAALAYIVGNADLSAQADGEMETVETLGVGSLHVKEDIMIGTKANFVSVSLQGIVIKSGNNSIILTASEEGSSISIHQNENFDIEDPLLRRASAEGSIRLSVIGGDERRTLSGIVVKDDRGRLILTTTE